MRTHFAFFLIILSSISFAQNTFYKTFDLGGWVVENNNIRTKDNGFACVTSDRGILKLDSTTQTEFYIRLNSDSIMSFVKMIQTTDSGFIFETPYNHFDIFGIGCVVKFDKNGNYLWSKRYSASESGNTISNIISSNNNGFYVLTGGCSGPAILIKCSETGDILWQKKPSNHPGLNAYKIINYSEDKFLIAGATMTNYYLQKIDIYLVDTLGNYLWLKEYDNNKFNLFSDIIKTANNEYSILFQSRNYVGNLTKAKSVTLHIDSLGNILWSKENYSNDSIWYYQFYSLTETSDKGYLYTGELKFTGTDTRLICAKTDSLNNIEWSKYFDNSSYGGGPESGNKAFEQNGHYFVFGQTGYHISIIKLDQNGYGFCRVDSINLITEDTLFTVTSFYPSSYITSFSCIDGYFEFDNDTVSSAVYCPDVNAINENKIYNTFNYYPNPTTGIFTLNVPSETKEINIFNSLGQIVQRKIVNGQTNIDFTLKNSGIYFIQINTDRQTTTKKLIVTSLE